MAAAPLTFAFARENGVVLTGGTCIAGPDATEIGLREALRVAGATAPRLIHASAEDFALRLTETYEGGGDTSAAQGADDSIVIDGATREPSPKDLLDGTEEAPVIRLVNHLFRRAVESGASDLHVEPNEAGLRVRMRLDGMLQPIYAGHVSVARRVISRLKVMAGLDIAETRLPQDGHIPLRYGGRSIDIRISTLPGNYGERVVMRVLDRASGLLPLDGLGMSADQVAQMERLSAMPNGIVLATGPTGSGKTTTLYSLLKMANRVDRNILTVEDPIEYDIEGINQSQIHTEIGLTFAKGLRAALRQDPDIILVGEIRDGETASVANQAALTGHLVFSSLHANGSVAAISRLRDLGLADYLIAATLGGIIAQRLLRTLCPHCSAPGRPDAAARSLFEDAGIPPPADLRHATGCAACRHTGYAGRIGVYEILPVDDALRSLIDGGTSEAVIRAKVLPQDRTLWAEALGKVAAGVTDLGEALRVIGAPE